MKKLIIIPAFNESATIVKTVDEIRKYAPEFDYIIINDCSDDDTGSLCRKHGLKMIDLPLNLGIGGAVQTGYRYARDRGYDMAVQVDGDGQHDPAFLRKMARKLEQEDADMVIGSRFLEKKGFQSSLIRRAGIRYFTGLIYLVTGKKITDPTSGLRIVGKRAIALFADHYPEDYPEPESVTAVLKRGWKVKEIPVVMRERGGGVSSISMKQSVYYMIKVTLAILIEVIRKEAEDEY
ncbi:MAG: glycosyltransferase family 2 protein [Ruminococcus sp.]|jgi:glycosyltransferase involved in cell wall biosynthesis